MTSTSSAIAGSAMRREIAEQPGLVSALLARSRPVDLAAEIRGRRPDHLQIVARGTSGHAALHVKYLAESRLGLPLAIVAPSVVTQLDGAPWRRDDIVLAASQSGASPDLTACVASARAVGALTIAFVNAPGSALADAAERVEPLHAGEEVAVAATKSYTATLVALGRLVDALEPARETDWSALPAELGAILEDDSWLPSAVDRVTSADAIAVLGRGFGFATAREAALKIMETCGIPSLAYSSAEFRHGPIAFVGPKVVVIAVGDVDADLLAACRARGAEIVAPPRSRLAPELRPIAEILPLQQLALECAIALGRDPDRPEALSKATLTL